MSFTASSLGRAPLDVPAPVPPPESTSVWLEQSQLFRDYRAAFEVATGLALGLVARPPADQSLPGRGRRRFRGALTVAATASATEWFSLVPVTLGDLTLGWLRLGPFHPGTDDAPVHDARSGLRVSPPTLGPSAHHSVLGLLRVFALHLAEASNDLIIHVHGQEPAYVETARQYIEAHLTDTLSLTVVAAAVNVSPYYFCKRFHESTGLHFTEYVNRARVARVKDLLLNPHVHVSEAAFAAGFQSLSQFNRAFRRVTGEAPSTFRHRLHHAR